MTKIEIEITEPMFERLKQKQDINEYIKNCIYLQESIENILLSKHDEYKIYKMIVDRIKYLETFKPSPSGKIFLHEIISHLKLDMPYESGLSVKVSKKMRDLNLYLDPGSGNYRVLDVNKHKTILQNLYKIYLNGDKI